LKLSVKYSATMLALISCIVLAFAAVILIQFRSEIARVNATSSATLRQSILGEIRKKEEVSVRVMASALTNPLYQVDMLKIGELVEAFKKRPDVLYVYVYDENRRIIHDGTSDLTLYGKVLDDILTVNSTREQKVFTQFNGDELELSAPITILDDKVGGIRVGYSLKTLLGYIADQQGDLDREYQAVASQELHTMVIIAIGFSLAGVILAVVLARSWSNPITVLSSLTARVGRGDYDVTIPINRSDEIGQLAQSFSSMVTSLKELREKDIKQSEAVRAINSQLQQTNDDLVREVAERQRAEKQVLHQNRQLEVLYEIDSAISSTLDRRVLLDVLFDKIESLLPYAALTVRLLNEDTHQLEPVSARNIDMQQWARGLESRSAITGRGFSQEVFLQKTPAIIENVQTDPRCWNQELFRKNGLVSYIGLPLITEGKALGVLGFYVKEQRSFPKEEVEFLSALAGQVAIGINNAQLYEKIKKQALALEEANQAKDEFLSVMSHELRTPLNVITGYAEVLSQGVLGEIQREQMHAVKTISFQSRELLRMINEILQVGSIEAGKIKAHCESVNMLDFLVEVKSGYEILSKKETSLHWNIPSSLPIVRTDGEKLKHVLQNLINNAIKFTENGSVMVSVRCISEVIQFKVKDTGIGIPQDMIPSIFQMFRQLDSSSTRSYGGSGVGLYIVKKFVDLLDGTIEVESVLGKGSTFTVTLSLDVAEMSHSNLPEDLDVKLAG
jgi:signal transduction histidine kinase/HAMP domain-containing protein